MDDQQAIELSRVMAEPNLLPECKKAIANSLLGYYRDLLASRALPIVPTVRRMF